MIIYVAHAYGGQSSNFERAKRITHSLQCRDLRNTYICPLLAFSHLQYGELGFDEEMELCLDILSQCDKLIVASPISRGVRREIEFAKMVGMEIEYLEH